MSESFVLKTNAEPTYFNKDTAIGFLILGPIGGIVGGWIGKSRMETEKKVGKPVSATPSFWNKDALLGGLIGDFAGAIIGSLAMLAMGTPIGLGVGFATWLTGVVIGTYVGGKVGEKRIAQEYEEAKRQKIVEQLSQNVSPEIGKAVEYRMVHDKQWAKEELENRLLNAAQEQGR